MQQNVMLFLFLVISYTFKVKQTNKQKSLANLTCLKVSPYRPTFVIIIYPWMSDLGQRKSLKEKGEKSQVSIQNPCIQYV